MSSKLAAVVAALAVMASSSGAAAQVVVGAGPVPAPPPGQYVPPDSSVRFTVTPKDAEVYVDGYYAGIVDEFDGTFQRLRVVPGPHDITLFKDGFHSFSQKVYLSPNNTFKIRHTLDPLGADEQPDPRPVPPPGPPIIQPPPGSAPPRTHGRREPDHTPPPQQPPPEQAPTSAPGTLALRVQPGGAEVVIDGEPWRGPSDTVRLELPAGRHNVQIRKSGYVGYLTDVDVRTGETTSLNVSLKAQSQ
jgi:hypothetical protein